LTLLTRMELARGWNLPPTVASDFVRGLQARNEVEDDPHPRAASPVDLITAATAAEYGAIVLHYDRDYDLIAQIGGPRSQWVAPAGSVP
jgi:predicted nucleic acid-binding protein